MWPVESFMEHVYAGLLAVVAYLLRTLVDPVRRSWHRVFVGTFAGVFVGVLAGAIASEFNLPEAVKYAIVACSAIAGEHIIMALATASEGIVKQLREDPIGAIKRLINKDAP